jgi:hypothetical protein
MSSRMPMPEGVSQVRTTMGERAAKNGGLPPPPEAFTSIPSLSSLVALGFLTPEEAATERGLAERNVADLLPPPELEKDDESITLVGEGEGGKPRSRRPEVIPNRLTVVETIYHQSKDNDPVSSQTGFCRNLETEEQVYRRDLHLDAEKGWQPLDIGWLRESGCSHLSVTNKGGKRSTVQPTPEERAEMATRIVDIYYGWTAPTAETNPLDCLTFLLPGESFRVTPMNPGLFYLRCRQGKTMATIFAYPL